MIYQFPNDINIAVSEIAEEFSISKGQAHESLIRLIQDYDMTDYDHNFLINTIWDYI